MSADYWRPLREALDLLAEASPLAQASLPFAIKDEIAALRRSRQVVSLWHHLASEYRDNVELAVLVLIHEFASGIAALEIEQEAKGRPVDLRLGKMRREPETR